MEFKNTLLQRLFNLLRFSTPSISRTAAAKPPIEPPEPSRIKRNMQRSPLYQSALPLSSAGLRLFPPPGENLVEQLKQMNNAKDRIRLSGLIPLHDAPKTAEREVGLSVNEIRKVLRASQVELIRSKLGEIERDWVTYNEFLGLIEESCGGN